MSAYPGRVQVSVLARYPVKSCRGHAVAEAVVEPWGLAGDRRWMVVGPDGGVASARTLPRMLLAEPRPDGRGGLVLHAPGLDDMAVAEPVGGPLIDVEVWGDELKATLAADTAHAWFSAHLDTPVRLVHLDDPTRRATDPEFSTPDDRVSFADSYPLLLTTEASLAALGELVAGEPPTMTRFRPNVVVEGVSAWAEEDWTGVTIGAARFRVPKLCSRCVLTTIDPETAVKGKEPLAALVKHRRRQQSIPFGLNLIPDTPGVTIRVGDPVVPT